MHVSITGGKFRRVQVMEQFKDQKTGKYRSRVIKDYGKLDELVALDPNFVEKLRAECREESKKEKELRKVTIQIDNCMLNSAGDAAQCFRFGHAAILKLFTDMGLEDFFRRQGRQEEQESSDGYHTLPYTQEMLSSGQHQGSPREHEGVCRPKKS